MVNNCTFIGRLGKDPEHKTSQSGSSFTNFSIAIDKGGKKEEGSKPLWLNVTCFGKTAEFVGTYLKKGGLVYIQGELAVEEYTNKEGQAKTSIKVLANTVKSLERKAEGSATTPAGTSAPAAAVAKANDDDIPF